jgi:hypothetical protein
MKMQEAFEYLLNLMQEQYMEYGEADFPQCHQETTSDFELTEEESDELKDMYDKRSKDLSA